MIALAFILVLTFCAHERNRTFTPLRMADFESAASTNSATWAALIGCNITSINQPIQNTIQIFFLIVIVFYYF